MHGRGCAWQGVCVVGACVAGGMRGRGVCMAGGVHGGGMHGGGLCVADTMRYASYWNAFLFMNFLRCFDDCHM